MKYINYTILATSLTCYSVQGMEQSNSQPLFNRGEKCLIIGTKFDNKQCTIIKEYTYFADSFDPEKPVTPTTGTGYCYNQLCEELSEHNDTESKNFLQKNTSNNREFFQNIYTTMQKYGNYNGRLYAVNLNGKTFFVNESHLKKINS